MDYGGRVGVLSQRSLEEAGGDNRWAEKEAMCRQSRDGVQSQGMPTAIRAATGKNRFSPLELSEGT